MVTGAPLVNWRSQKEKQTAAINNLAQGGAYGGYFPVDSDSRIPCPYCREMILKDSQLCHFCRADLRVYMEQRNELFRKQNQYFQDRTDFRAARTRSRLSQRALAEKVGCSVRTVKEIECDYRRAEELQRMAQGQFFEGVVALHENFSDRTSVQRRLCDAIGFTPSGWIGSAAHAADVEVAIRTEAELWSIHYKEKEIQNEAVLREKKEKEIQTVAKHLRFLAEGGQLTAPTHSSESTICPHCHRLISYPEWQQMTYGETRRCRSCKKNVTHMPKRPQPKPAAKKEDPAVRAREAKLQRELEEKLQAEQELGYEAIKCPFCSLFIPVASNTCPSCSNHL